MITAEEFARKHGIPWRKARRYAKGGGRRARALLLQHPDWPAERVAVEAGVAIATVYRAKLANREDQPMNRDTAVQLAAELPPCTDCGAAPESIGFAGGWAVGERHEPGCQVDADLEAVATKDEAVDLRGPGGAELRAMVGQEIAAAGLEFSEELARMLAAPPPEPPPAAE